MPHSALNNLEKQLEQLVQRFQHVLQENNLLRQQITVLKNEHGMLAEKNQVAIKKIKDTIIHLRKKLHEPV
jgi:uncharacterized protein (TIGR02449 family)